MFWSIELATSYVDKVAALASANLVGYWPCDESSGATTVDDESANGFDGTAQNGVMFGVTGIGDGGTAARFDETQNQRIDLPSGLNSAFPQDEGSLLFWFKSPSSSWSGAGDDYFFIATTDWSARLTAIPDLRFAAADASYTRSTLPNDTNWHCFVLTWSVSADELKTYVDGTLVDTTSGLSSLGASISNIYIGARTTSLGFVDGDMAHIAIWSRPLTQTEVDDLNTVETVADSLEGRVYLGEYYDKVIDSAPIGYWRLHEYDAHNALAADSSGNGYDGTRYNVVAAGRSIGDLHPMAKFDGDYDWIDVYHSGLASDFDTATGGVGAWVYLDEATLTDGLAHFIALFEVNSSNRVRLSKTGTDYTIEAAYVAGGTVKTVSHTVQAGLHFLLLTWDTGADEIEFFLDGISAGTASGLGTWSGSIAYAVIGADTDGSAYHWAGYIAHVMLFDAVLGTDAISALAIPAGRDVSEYSIVASITSGRNRWQQRAASIGQCSVELDNRDRRFSPEYTGGPYYGELTFGLPVRIDVTDGITTWTRFRGRATRLDVMPDQYGLERATYEFEDRLGDLQATNITIPLLENITADELMRRVTSDAYKSGIARIDVYGIDPADGDTITIADKTYTVKNSGTNTPNEVYRHARAWGVATGAQDVIANLADAINAADSSGLYDDSTTKHDLVTAGASMGIGLRPTGSETDQPLAESTNSYDELACAFRWQLPSGDAVNEPDTITFVRVYLYLKKVGSPTGTLTLELVRPRSSDGNPSTTRAYTGAVATLDESTLTTSYAWYAFDFPSEEINVLTQDTGGADSRLHWLRLSTDRAISGTDYVAWAAESGSGFSRFKVSEHNDGADWNTITDDKIYYCWISGVLTVTAEMRGVWGNDLAVSQSGDGFAWPTFTGGNFEGGSDGPAGYIDYDTNMRTFTYGADAWTESTNALRAATEVAEGEYGVFYCAGDGTLRFLNRDAFFIAQSDDATITVDNEHNLQVAAVDIADLVNYVAVRYMQRELSDLTPVARANSDITVPGRLTGITGNYFSGNQGRYNVTDKRTTRRGEKLVTLPYVLTESGANSGATDLALPPVAGTDYEVIGPDGFDYTNSGRIRMTVAVGASGIEVLLVNTATGPLTVENLQIRGKFLKRAESFEISEEDTDSQDAYRVRARNYTFPLPTANPGEFAVSLAKHWLALYADPQTVVESVGFRGEYVVDNTHTFALQLSDTMQVSETQTDIDYLLWIVGRTETIRRGDLSEVRYFVVRLDKLTYWILGTSGHSEIGQTTYMGF